MPFFCPACIFPVTAMVNGRFLCSNCRRMYWFYELIGSIDKDEHPMITLKNGDTPAFTRVEFSFSKDKDHEKVIALLKFGLEASSRRFDGARKCWFVATELIDRFLAGIKALADMGEISSWYANIDDQRVSVQSFEEFFETPPPVARAAKSKEELIKLFEQILKGNAIYVSVREDIPLDEAKKLYRRAALAFHPDRNNGDGSKMSELNVIWTELQPKL